MITTIAILLIVAAALLVKLYSILGKGGDLYEGMRNQYDDGSCASKSQQSAKKNIIDITKEVRKNKIAKKKMDMDMDEKDNSKHEMHAFHADGLSIEASSEIEKDMIALKNLYPLINKENILQCAGNIYIRLMDSYSSGDLTSVEHLISSSIFKSLSNAMKAKMDADIFERVVLIKILNIQILSAGIKNTVPEVKLLFKTQQLHYSENKQKDLLTGSKHDDVIVSETLIFVYKGFIGTEDVTPWILAEIKDH